MLTFEQARERAKSFINELGDAEFGRTDLVLNDEHVQTHSTGWVFPYNTNKFLETGHPLDGLIGNRPLFIDRFDGSVHIIPTGPIDGWIARYSSKNPRPSL